MMIGTIILFSCDEEELLLSNSQDAYSDKYIVPPGDMTLLLEDENTVKIMVFGDGTAFSAQILRKKSGWENWEIIINETELGDTIIYFDSYKLELNTTYLYQVRKISEGYESRAITDSIYYQFFPPILKDMNQISDVKIELNWILPDQFVNDTTIKKVLITREGAGKRTEIFVGAESTTFIDSTIPFNNISYNYSLRSEAFSGTISDRSEKNEIAVLFPKLDSHQWLPLKLDQMQIDFTFSQDQFSFIRSTLIRRYRTSLSTEKIIYQESTLNSTFLKLVDTLNEAELSEQILYTIKWCGEVFCDSLEVTAKTLPFRYMTLIPGSEQFSLGPEYDNNNDGKQAVVKVDSFYASIYEVREAIYQSPGSEYIISDIDLPISNISWNEAVEFCNKHTKEHFGAQFYAYGSQKEVNLQAVGFRLPTEIEWEYMASYGEDVNMKREFPWGNNISGHYANYYGSGDQYEPGPTPVGYYDGLVNTLRDGESFFGLQDLAGNVMEWCHDWYSDSAYENHDYTTNPEGPSNGQARVVRGGGWQSDAIECNNRMRKEFLPTVSHETIGFRTVITAEPFLKMWRSQ